MNCMLLDRGERETGKRMDGLCERRYEKMGGDRDQRPGQNGKIYV